MRSRLAAGLFGFGALALVAAAAVAHFSAAGIARREVVIASRSGNPLRAVLVLPEKPPSPPGPAVVAIPPYSIPPEAMETICFELAHRGAACAIPDFFGRSPAESRQHMGKDSLAVMTLDALSLIGYLRSLPGVDGKRIGVCGHSVGGTVTVLAAMADPEVAAAIPIGMEADFGPRLPRNLLFLSGLYDEIHSPNDLVENLKNNGVTDDPRPGVLYGNFGRGDARQVTIVPTTDHFIETFDPWLIRALLSWYARALDAPELAAGSLREWPRRVAAFGLALTVGGFYLLLAGALAGRVARRLGPGQPDWLVARVVAMAALPLATLLWLLGGSLPGFRALAPDLMLVLVLAQEGVNQRARAELRWPGRPPYRLFRGLCLLLAALGIATLLTYGLMSAPLYLRFPRALAWYPVFALDMALLFPLEVWGRMRPWFFSETIAALTPSTLYWMLLATVTLAPGVLFRLLDRVASELLITARARLRPVPAPAAAREETAAASAPKAKAAVLIVLLAALFYLGYRRAAEGMLTPETALLVGFTLLRFAVLPFVLAALIVRTAWFRRLSFLD
jgi:hypothetical protein